MPTCSGAWLLAYPVPSRAHTIGARQSAARQTRRLPPCTSDPSIETNAAMSRRCIDCPTIIHEGSRCPTCARAKDAARGTPAQRGYGPEHTALRAEYQRRMDAGERFLCWRCGKPIDPASWDLGHDDDDRSVYRGPEGRDCNRAVAGRISRGA